LIPAGVTRIRRPGILVSWYVVRLLDEGRSSPSRARFVKFNLFTKYLRGYRGATFLVTNGV
jgi:hypothetical protein